MLFNPTNLNLRKVAFLETAANGGSDTSGAVGDPTRPFATPNAAFAALVQAAPVGQNGTLVFGVGNFAQLNLTNLGISTPVNLSVQGHGEALSIWTGVSWHGNARTLVLQDTGFKSVAITTIEVSGEIGQTGSSNSNGADGQNGGSLTIRSLRVTGNVVADGGAGGEGGIATSGATNGGNGGAGGAIQIRDCWIDGYVSSRGGPGGEPGQDEGGGTGTGGFGNSGGEIIAVRSRMAHLYLNGAFPGSGGTGGSGGTTETFYCIIPGDVDVSGEGGGASGTATHHFGHLVGGDVLTSP